MLKGILLAGVIVAAVGESNDCTGLMFLLQGPLLVVASSKVERRAPLPTEEWETCLTFTGSYLYGKQVLCNGYFYRVVGFSGYDQPARRAVNLYDAFGPYKAVTQHAWRGALLNFTCYDEETDTVANTFNFIAAPVDEHVCLVAAIKDDIYHYALFSHHNHTCLAVAALIEVVKSQGYDLFGKSLEPSCCYS